MEPQIRKYLIIVGMVMGLVLTQSCGGGSGSGDSDLTPGQGNNGGVTISNEVNSPAEMEVGDIMMLQFSSASPSEFDFSDVDETSKYYLAVGSLSTGYGYHNIQLDNLTSGLGADNLVEAASDNYRWDGWNVSEAFDQRLRGMELAIALDPDAQKAGLNSNGVGLKLAMMSPDIAVGDTEEIRVLNSLTSYSYTTVTARVKCVASNLIVYLDTEVEERNPEDLTDEDISRLCDEFNDQIAVERALFGAESDVNNDNRVAALFTPQVNKLGAIGGGIITGFFMSADLYDRAYRPISNEREIVYAMVPDSRGIYGAVIPKTFGIENLLTAVLPHEFQHVISFNQHVFEGEGGNGLSEEDWLNEGLSHLAEDLVGYGQENASRYDIYLSDTDQYSVAGAGSPGLGERGAAYLFLRFLYEQSPDPEAFLRRLYSGHKSGVANLEAAFDGQSANFDQFGEFFMRWIVALAMTGRDLSSDARYVYQTPTLNSETNRWQGVCLVCNTEDGRGTVLNGPSMTIYSGADGFNLESSGIKFYEINSVPATISFSTSSSEDMGAVLIRNQ